MLRMCWEPVEGGYIPEMMAVRAGAQTGAFDPGMEIDHALGRERVQLGRGGVSVAVGA